MNTIRLEQALSVHGVSIRDAHAMSDVQILKIPGVGPKGLRAIRERAQTVVVTRHAALIELLIERGVIDPTAKVIDHATADDVRGRHVIGVLPLALAAQAASITEIPLDLAPEDRGKELNIERLRQVAGDPIRYTVREAQP